MHSTHIDRSNIQSDYKCREEEKVIDVKYSENEEKDRLVVRSLHFGCWTIMSYMANQVRQANSTK